MSLTAELAAARHEVRQSFGGLRKQLGLPSIAEQKRRETFARAHDLVRLMGGSS